jgi:hypothetical protein
LELGAGLQHRPDTGGGSEAHRAGRDAEGLQFLGVVADGLSEPLREPFDLALGGPHRLVEALDGGF